MEAVAVLALKALLPILLTWAAARFDHFVRSKVKNDKLQALLLRIDDAASTAVLAIGQTYADGLSRGLSDGKLVKAEADEAKRRALDEAKRQLGPEGWAKWCELLGGSVRGEEGLSARIEAALKRAKTRFSK